LGELLLLNLLHLATAEKAQMTTLEVRRSNRGAQALYSKYRFDIVGERRRYYRDGEDALLMTAVLDEDYGRFLEQQKNTLFTRLEITTDSH
jgi:ribosomal-protein-alanine N-acetyltransferase